MKKFQILGILIIFLGLSCQDVNHPKRPDNLIPEDKMANILTEIALLNAARNYNKFLLEQTGLKPNEYIYTKFGIDSLQFEKSNTYYADNYNEYQSIYTKVKDTLDALKSEYKDRVEEERKADSIKKIKPIKTDLSNKDPKDSLAIDRLKDRKTSFKKAE
ncbi:DUF4296 domain-containing protein [Zunongwangia sp.]|uniref:DUF4296 domain-containing protein n=1 Tax=Zunongwangia sp. TaxID=1965325 RepID=UPI003AA93695